MNTNTIPGTSIPANLRNMHFSYDEVEQIIAKTTEDMHAANKLDSKGKDSIAKGKALIKQVYTSIHEVMESYGLDRGVDNAKVYKDNADYEALRTNWCTRMSERRSEKINLTKDGAPIFGDAVKKQWSRMVTAYREHNEDGTQSAADQAAKAAKADKIRTDGLKAVLLDAVSDSYEKLRSLEDDRLTIPADTDEYDQATTAINAAMSGLRTLLDRAVMQVSASS